MRALAVLLAVLAFTTPAAAQDGSGEAAQRTPSGAQEFLAATSKDAQVIYWEEQWSKPGGLQTRNNRSRAYFGKSPESHCQTMLIIDVEYEMEDAAAPRGHWRTTTQKREWPFSWNDVSQISLESSTVSLSWTSGLTAMNFTYPSAELARRTAAAFEFLRIECDENKDIEKRTGF